MEYEAWKLAVTVKDKHHLTGAGNGVTRRGVTKIKLGESEVMRFTNGLRGLLRADGLFDRRYHTIASSKGRPLVRNEHVPTGVTPVTAYFRIRPGEVVILSLKPEFRANRYTKVRDVAFT